MVEATRERLARHATQVEFVVADLMAPLPLPDAGVDAILSTATFHWVPDHDRLFRHLARVLRPGEARGPVRGLRDIASLRAALAEIGGDLPDPWTFATAEETVAGSRPPASSDRHGSTTSRRRSRQVRRSATTSGPSPSVRRWRGARGARTVPRRVIERLPGPAIDFVRLNIVAQRDAGRG